MSTYVFIGPTISESEARQWLEAIYLPPAAQGDILSLLRYSPQVIGMIDGYYENVPSVWHKEILLALEQGVQVVGAASMGALRAAELHTFGMVGIGQIFEWYRDGVLEADDEVAVHHASAELGYQPLSEALVNIRKTLQVAREQSVIADLTCNALLNIARGLPFWQRSYSALLTQARRNGFPENELAHLETFLKSSHIDLKKQDAILALQYIAELGKHPPAPTHTSQIHRTIFLDSLFDRDMSFTLPGQPRLTPEDLVMHARLVMDNFPALQRRAADTTALLALARLLNLAASQSEIQAETEKYLEQHKVTVDERAAWMEQHHLTANELAQFVEEKLLLEKVRSLFAAQGNRAILRQLRLEDLAGYEKLAESSLECEQAFAGDNQVENLPLEELLRAYCIQSGRELPISIEQLAGQLGFPEPSILIVQLQKLAARQRKI